MKLRFCVVSSVVLLSLACNEDESPDYSAQAERSEMARITGRWQSPDGTVRVDVCEDMQTILDPIEDDACNATTYQVRSEGGVRLASRPGGTGCGGCGYSAGGLIYGTVTRAGSSYRFRGNASFGDDDGEPDAEWLNATVTADEGERWTGRAALFGTLEVAFGDNGIGNEPLVLSRTGDADCGFDPESVTARRAFLDDDR